MLQFKSSKGCLIKFCKIHSGSILKQGHSSGPKSQETAQKQEPIPTPEEPKPSSISSFFTKLENKFQETRRKEEEKAVEKKKISPEMAKKAQAFFEGESSSSSGSTFTNSNISIGGKKMDLQRSLLDRDAVEFAYYKHAKQVAKEGAKLWQAPTSLIPLSNAPRMYGFEGGTTMDQSPFSIPRLIGMKQCLLVGIFFNQFGEVFQCTYDIGLISC